MRGLVSSAMALVAVSVAISCGDAGTGPGDQITTLAIGAPRTDIVARGGTKSYAVPVTAGAMYQISLTGMTDDVDLYPFGDDGTFTIPENCLIDHTLFFGTDPEDCTVVATGPTMYVGVDASDVTASSATYTIAVRSVPLTSLTLSQPLEGSIASDGTSFYSVGVTPGANYSFSISGLTDSATIFHVSDGEQGGTLLENVSPKDLRLIAVGSTTYLVVDGSELTHPTAAFRILAAPAPVISGPIVPTSGAVPARTPTVGWVETRSTSRYRTDGLPAGTHTISILGATGDVVFHLYGDDTYSLELDCTLRNFGARECAVTGTSVFFSVASGPVNRDGAGYIILVW
jgi:hypothetical protein